MPRPFPCAAALGARQLLTAERDENTCRLNLAPSEAIAMAAALEPFEREAAKQRQVEAGKVYGKGKKPMASGKLPEAMGGRSRDAIAAAVGMSGKTYEKARAVVEVFKLLLETRDVKRQRGGDRTKEQRATVALCSEELGIPEDRPHVHL